MQLLCWVSLREAGCAILLTAKSQVRCLKASPRLKELFRNSGEDLAR